MTLDGIYYCALRDMQGESMEVHLCGYHALGVENRGGTIHGPSDEASCEMCTDLACELQEGADYVPRV